MALRASALGSAPMDLSTELQRRYALAVFISSVLLLIGGYLIGHAGGSDVDAARAAGASRGAALGKKQGTKEGRAAGFKKGYKLSYKAAYKRAKRGD
jgi:hypothetical protein